MHFFMFKESQKKILSRPNHSWFKQKNSLSFSAVVEF